MITEPSLYSELLVTTKERSNEISGFSGTC